MSIKVAILSPGRFHVCDLARELHELGLEVRFYSYVPVGRTTRFGLDESCARSVFIYVLPFLAIKKCTRQRRARGECARSDRYGRAAEGRGRAASDVLRGVGQPGA